MISIEEYKTICQKFNLVPYLNDKFALIYQFPESNNFGSNVIVTTFGSYGARICKYYDSAHQWVWLPWRAYLEEFEKDLIELSEIVKQMTIKKKKEEIYKDFSHGYIKNG